MNPLQMVPTEVLIEELKKRHYALVIVGVLVNENTGVSGSHVCHWSGPNALAIGLTALANDFLRKKFALDTPVSGNIYG